MAPGCGRRWCYGLIRGKVVQGREDGGVFSGGYWSIRSGSKQSRYPRSWGKDGWLSRGEFLKRRIDESGGRGASI